MKKFNQLFRSVITVIISFSLIFSLSANGFAANNTRAFFLQDKTYENVDITVNVSEDVPLTEAEIEEVVAGEFEKFGIEVIPEGKGAKTLEVSVTLQRKDGDLDDDGVPDAKDPDDDGNGTKDSEEKVTPLTKDDVDENSDAEPVEDSDEPEAKPTPTPSFLPISFAPGKSVTAPKQQFDPLAFSLKFMSEIGSFQSDIASGKIDPTLAAASLKELELRASNSLQTTLSAMAKDLQKSLAVSAAKFNEHLAKLKNSPADAETMKELLKALPTGDDKIREQLAKVVDAGITKTNQENNWVSKFEKRGVKIFEGRDSQGKSASFGVGTYNANNGPLNGIGNDTASSVQVPAGYKVKLCSTEGANRQGAGDCEEYGEGNHNLRYAKQASWVKVWLAGSDTNNEPVGVTIFEGRDFQGKSAVFGNGIFNANNGPLNGIANDAASSVIVPKDFMVRICEHEGRNNQGGGNCEEYGAGKYNLKYNKQASWIRVWIP